MDVRTTDPKHWKYVSEGGATIVFSYQGPEDPHFSGTVLRLRKAIVPRVKSGKHTDSNDQEPDDPTIQYQKLCMERLIPPVHLPRLETVGLDRAWLEKLIALTDSLRPLDRRSKDQIDLDRTKGVLATDLVGGDWIAVEIKPKWGFMPSTEHLSKATAGTKAQTCRFCMHTHMRGGETDYCPLDLYSGDETRVRKAVETLWDGWVASKGTLNNLKIFAGGKFVEPSHQAILLLAKNKIMAQESVKEAFAAAVARSLLDTPVLRILADLQRDLDALDIEGLAKLWRATETSAPLYRTTFASFFEQSRTAEPAPPTTPLGVSSLFLQSPEPNLADWSEFLDTYLLHKPKFDHAHPSPEHLRYYLLAYLLSATFKDCSVIVRLNYLDEPRAEMKPESVVVIDLDPKSMDKLKGWEKLDKEIVLNYAGSKVCHV